MVNFETVKATKRILGLPIQMTHWTCLLLRFNWMLTDSWLGWLKDGLKHPSGWTLRAVPNWTGRTGNSRLLFVTLVHPKPSLVFGDPTKTRLGSRFIFFASKMHLKWFLIKFYLIDRVDDKINFVKWYFAIFTFFEFISIYPLAVINRELSLRIQNIKKWEEKDTKNWHESYWKCRELRETLPKSQNNCHRPGFLSLIWGRKLNYLAISPFLFSFSPCLINLVSYFGAICNF